MNEADALQCEMFKIYLYGRIDIGTGILRNKTNGDEGGHGYIPSEESKKKMSEAKLGRKLSEKTKKKMSERQQQLKTWVGKKHTDITKKHISKNNGKGFAKVTPEQVREIRHLYANTNMSQKEIGKLFGIASSTTNQIITKKWWKDII